MIAFKQGKNILRRLDDGMEIELGVNVKRSARDLTFVSIESETVFVLLGHLPGFMQDKIATSINEVRQEICICGVGDKAFLDTAIGGRLRLTNEFETNSFKKVFGIPNGVALDQIEVCFNEEDAILMILMPKSIDIEGEVGERGTREIVKEDDALIASSKVDGEELNRNGLATDIHREEDEETKHEEVDESNKKFDPPKRPSVEIKAPNIEQQLPPPPVGAKEDESPGTSEVNQALDQPKIPENIDNEREEQEKQEDKKGDVGRSHEIKEEDKEQVHELDDKPIYEKGLPQQLIEEPETSNVDKLPMKEVKGNGSKKKKGIVDGREASDVDQTLGHPKTSQNVEEEQEKQEDMKRSVGESQGMKEEDEEQIHEPDDKPTDNKGLPRQLIEEPETSNADKLPMKEVKGNGNKKEKGIVGEREIQEIDKEREASDVNQTLGHPKTSQNVDKEQEEEQEDMKRSVGESQGMKEEGKEQTDNKGLPRQLIEERETRKKDELPTKEMKVKKRKKEQEGGLGVTPPSLVVSAFLLSLVALVIKLVRNQKRT